MSSNEPKREKPFTDNYTQWDKPSFDPSKTYLSPKPIRETSNRSVLSRLYERVIEQFRDARVKLLTEKAGEPMLMHNENRAPEVMGNDG